MELAVWGKVFVDKIELFADICFNFHVAWGIELIDASFSWFVAV